MAKMAIVAFFAVFGVATAYTSNNNPMSPGNDNLPVRPGGFQLETEKNLPVVNIKYRFNAHSHDAGAMFAEAQADLAFGRRLQDVLRLPFADVLQRGPQRQDMERRQQRLHGC